MVKIKEDKIIIKPIDFKPSSKDFEIIGTINPAVARLSNGDILLYVRVIEKLIKDEDKEFVYSPRMIGKKDFKYTLDKFPKSSITEKNPLDFGFIDDGEFGIEDPRITKIKDRYIMTYVTLSKYGDISVSYAISKDLKNWRRKGVMFQEQNKDVIIFPEIIGDHYIAINRPEGNFQFSLPHMWLSYSKDLKHWGHPKPLILSKSKIGWDSGRVGSGTPPIKTKKGWLILYHAVEEKKVNDYFLIKLLKKTLGLSNIITQYNVGAVILKLENPSEILMKTKDPLFSPTKKYEKGVIEKKNVIFPTGMVLSNNKKDLLIYSGAGDVMTEVKKISINEIMKALRKI